MASEVLLCDICNQRHLSINATAWCPECQETICSNCNEHHSLAKSSVITIQFLLQTIRNNRPFWPILSCFVPITITDISTIASHMNIRYATGVSKHTESVVMSFQLMKWLTTQRHLNIFKICDRKLKIW